MNPMKIFCTVVLTCFGIVAFTFNATAAVQRIEAGPDSATNGLLLQTAIADAASGDTIYLSRGTYLGNFEIRNGISIFGGFVDTVNWSFATRDSRLTICDGDSKASVFAVPTNIEITDTAVLDGITIENGKRKYQGGGVDALEGLGYFPVWVNNCIVQKNTANRAAGIYGAIVSKSIITNNIGIGVEGGIISDCVITTNSGDGITSGTVTNCVIANNGGAGCSAGTVQNCVIANNGGAGCSAGTVQNCVIANNGGAGCSAGTVRNCVIVNNNAYGMALLDYSNVLANCVLWGNKPAQTFGQLAFWSSISNCAIQGETLSIANMDPDSGPQFLKPTSFSGQATTADSQAELAVADWRMWASSATDREVHATFDERVPLPMLTLVDAEGDSGAILPGNIVRVTPKNGEDFKYWLATGIELTADSRIAPNLSFVMPANNVTLQAVFVPVVSAFSAVGSRDGITIQFTGKPNTHYILLRSETEAFGTSTEIDLSILENVEYLDRDVIPGKTYFYKLRAYAPPPPITL